ncbi:MAG TPA: cytochrome c family protein [Caulobacteraceae bacterium]
MSDLATNKVLGAGLATALAIAILAIVPPLFFQKTPPAHPGYAIAVAPETSGGGGEVPDTPPDWGTVLPAADIAAGEAKTAACKSCHNFDPAGTNGIGPGLFGVVGRKPGSHPGFSYSPAMLTYSAAQPLWDYDHLYLFIKGPQAYLSGTKMTFVGLKSPQDRINVIAYLHSLGSNLPIPAPKPKAAVVATAPSPAPGGPPAAAGKPVAAPAGAPASAKPGTPASAEVQGKPGGPA